MNCIELIKKFISELNIPENDFQNSLDKISAQNRENGTDFDYTDSKKYIIRILTDTYKLNADNVKKCANKLAEIYVPLGRNEKDLLKHYLDYYDEKSLDLLCEAIGVLSEEKQYFTSLVDVFRTDFSEEAMSCFKENILSAAAKKDSSKIYDYLNGLYTRLVSLLSSDVLSLCDIFSYNEKFISQELEPDLMQKLKNFCKSENKLNSAEARRMFSDYYQEILDEDLVRKSNSDKLEEIMNKRFAACSPFANIETESAQLVVFNINQALFDFYESREVFFSAVMTVIKQSYRTLKNHKTIAFLIDNIFTEKGQNLKWELYSIIGIFAEHFIPTVEKRKFYKREELCFERCEYLGIPLDIKQKEILKNYYNGKIGIEKLSGIDFGEYTPDEVLLDFENIWYGYSFSDCLSVISGEYRQNKEISFIRNTNQLVMIFSKYRHDDRKIPCPDCAGLDISGNSFPEVGLRSWECKNTICPSRSKSNRGKRYSYKSNFMQRGYDDGVDLIPRELIKKWRRDITVVQDKTEIFEMLFQYFCFSNEKVLLINTDAIDILPKRYHLSYITLDEIKTLTVNRTIFEDYFSEEYPKRYLSTKRLPLDNTNLRKIDISKIKHSAISHGDCFEVLQGITNNTFTAAVTSPPYYNARLYSQWSNLYIYLSDMYEIAKQIFRTMKPGGVYLYNIGDICGNENTVVNSNMGNKRILLGAYTIHIFLKAGFELLDNLLWDKGEPQSNRQKNDGKFTPFYQKPMNVYEHMFLFKKPGAPAIISNSAFHQTDEGWNTNNVQFSPVIKINSKGENVLGHTAPFPEDIPNFVAKILTQNQSDIILEPFAGSGTSLIAAFKNNRRCLGIEISDEYVELIKSRCESEDVEVEIV